MKKINERGVAHHGLVALTLVLVIIAGAGYFVWSKQGTKSAKADNWTDLTGVFGTSLKDDSRIMACKSTVATKNSSTIVVKLQAFNENYIGDFNGSFEVKRDGIKAGEVLLTAKPYSVGKVLTTNFTIEPNDTWTGYITFRAGAVISFAGPWSFDKIADC